MSAYMRLLLPENLNFAWIKAKNLYRTADGYIDSGEIAAFELDLEQRLLDIRSQFERGTYRLKKLRPLPRPKKSPANSLSIASIIMSRLKIRSLGLRWSTHSDLSSTV